MNTDKKTRRKFLKESAALALTTMAFPAWKNEALAFSVFQAMGTRVGEVTDTTAIIWTRLTAKKERNNKGLVIPGRAQDYKNNQLPEPKVPTEELEGACQGISGFVRIHYGTEESLGNAKRSDWVGVSEKMDFIHHFHLKNLQSNATYFYESEVSANKNETDSFKIKGKFQTAPAQNVVSDIRFCLMTCQGYPDRGHPDGHHIYPAMLALKPRFACLTGDLVYYDNDMPRANNARLARYHWERMFSLPRLVDFNMHVNTYWLKDDHDTLDNDSSPGGNMGELSFTEGQHIFRQQAPISDGLSYRTFRWGKDLQIWLTDGRDFRSNNDMPDGPEKTIWGAEQKAWFKKTVKESTATWKILVSPTPLVGPDRVQKNDNHSNPGFKYEGDEIRSWIKENVPDNFFIVCGDRHWQYHSVHPETGLNEFSIGAASDEHAGGTPGENKDYHQFHLVKGGFMSVDVNRLKNKSRISFQHHDIYGAVVYKWEKERNI
ncbi:MAG: alkaline phosphatase D family protein [Saprospiraceae bacterium]